VKGGYRLSVVGIRVKSAHGYGATVVFFASGLPWKGRRPVGGAIGYGSRYNRKKRGWAWKRGGQSRNSSV